MIRNRHTGHKAEQCPEILLQPTPIIHPSHRRQIQQLIHHLPLRSRPATILTQEVMMIMVSNTSTRKKGESDPGHIHRPKGNIVIGVLVRSHASKRLGRGEGQTRVTPLIIPPPGITIVGIQQGKGEKERMA